MSGKPTILIAEDSPTQTAKLEHLLERNGYSVLSAPSGREALSIVRETTPALIISDILMPEMDGYELCRIVRQDPALARTPFILLTTLADMEDIIRGLDAQADYYVTKPYDDALLLSKIASLLSGTPDFLVQQSGEGMNVGFQGKRYRISSDPRQIVRLLLCTYENTILQNRALENARQKTEEINKALAANVEELQKSEARFRSLIMTIPDMVYRIDKEGRFTFFNDAVRNLGYEPDELIGRHFSEIILPLDVDTVSRLQVLQQFQGKKTGDQGAPKLFDERRTGIRRTSSLEVRLVLKNPKEIRPGLVEPIGIDFVTVEVNSSGMYQIDPAADVRSFMGTVGVIRDITERKRMENELKSAYAGLELKVRKRTVELLELNNSLKQQIEERKRAEDELKGLLEKIQESQSQLIQAEKMSALGTMVAGVAHELNNPMMSILNFVQYSIKHTLPEDKRHGILKDAEHETNRCIDIIQDLLTFSRIEHGGEQDYKTVRCSMLINRVLGFMQYRINEEKIDIITEYEDDGIEVRLQENKIQQVFINLLDNAMDSLKGRETRKITITTRAEGGSVRITVADTGRGIEQKNMEKIFDPFFTTKPVGQGTGLGLSVGLSIIESHGGAMGIESRPGEGTKVTVTLPLSGDPRSKGKKRKENV